MTFALTGIDNGQPVRWDVTDGTYRLGRSADSDVRLQDRSVSREHARLNIENGQATIEDLNSHNGTRVNGKDVAEPTVLQPGDRLQLGMLDLLFHSAEKSSGGEQPSAPSIREDDSLGAAVSLSWDEVQSEISTSSKMHQSLLTAMTQAGQLLVVPRPLEELLEAMLDLVERFIPPGRILLLLKDGEDDEPVVRASRLHGAAAGEDVLLSRTIVNTVMENRTSLLVTDVSSDPRFQAAQSVMALDLRSAMAAPLFDNEHVIGLIYADTSQAGVRYDRDQLGAFTLLANMIAVKITNTRLLEEQRIKERLEQEMETAARIQRSLLPAQLPEESGYAVFARQQSCLETAGDLYEVCRLPDGKLGIALGDVSGKGAGAALLMSHAMACMRVLFDQELPLVEFAQRLNRHIFKSSDPMSFVTLLIGRLDSRSHTFEFVNAGHDPPLLFAADGSFSRLDSTGMPIGLMETSPYTEQSVALPENGLLCVYSDGIPEAQRGEEFYETERLIACLKERRDEPLEEIVTGVLHDVQSFLGDHSQGDDITMLLLRRLR
ncbi:MAG: SpoIIE family protein phosphatase [Candidatus Eisenbacteria bacterium]|nr:SpoIIE family protein phosphatase [Candidatus Eisenbacteria bacterium]